MRHEFRSMAFVVAAAALMPLPADALAPWAADRPVSDVGAASAPQDSFVLEDVLSAPFPSGIVAHPSTGRVAWAQNAEGVRDVWVAEGPGYEGRRLTSYGRHDGQPASDLTFTPDGSRIVYVRGATPNREGVIANPTSAPRGQKRTVRVVSADGGEPRVLGEGHDPAVSPDGGTVAFLRNGDVWFASLAPESAEAEARIQARGSASDLAWSPEGRWLAFTSRREEHSVVGLYDAEADTLAFPDGTVDRDAAPAWDPDGGRLVYVRRRSEPRELPFTPQREAPEPWSLRVYDLETGEAREVWRAMEGPGSAFRGLASDRQVWWTAEDRLVFPWERTGWVHLYSVPASGGEAIELTPGEGIVEHAALAPDGRSVVYSSNVGDIDRRHLWRTPADGSSGPRRLTSGVGIEWGPAPLAEGAVAFLASGPRDPAHAEVLVPDGGAAPLEECGGADSEGGGERQAERRWLAPGSVPDRFPRDDLARPRQVIFSASDGERVHGQLFLPPALRGGEVDRSGRFLDRGGSGTAGGPSGTAGSGPQRSPGHPAVIFTHGGSRRQMLLGWHYMRYYHQAYAMNQYLAGRGYVVLSVNYRSGIGYGLEFREALNYGAAGASEFRDVEGAGVFLRGLEYVDPDRVGLWGGSYGGYLTALGLARASDLFAAGVDLHGVHDWNVVIRNFVPDYDPTARGQFADLAFRSSPVADADTWRSPVLFIHGDDDRNVPFTETVDMVAELRRQGVETEELVFPDEVHDFLLHRNWLRAYRAAADFFDRKLKE